MSVTRAVAPYPQTWTCTTAQIAASAPAGTVVSVSIVTDLSVGTSYSTVLIPPSQFLLIYDVYVTASPSVDFLVSFKVDNIQQGQNFGPVSQTLRSYGSGRLTMRNNPLLIRNSGLLSISAITLAANGTSAATESFTINVEYVPIGYRGPVVY